MLKNYFAVALLLTTASCNVGNNPQTSSTILLEKVKAVMDAEKLDYAVAKQFLGIPLHTSKFDAIASANEIISRSGDYGIKRGSTYPPEFTLIDFDMAWNAGGDRPSIHAWHKEKGLRSSLRLAFDIEKICITEDMLDDELGSGEEGGFSHGDGKTISYGELDDFFTSFTFSPPNPCADSMDFIANDSTASWPTPADISANDAEFVTTVLPIEKSGNQLVPLGMSCGMEDAKGRPQWFCGCDREDQRPTGPCHHAVEFIPLPDGELEMGVFPLLNDEAN